MRINDLKLGQGIGLISERAQTSAQMFAKLFNSKVNGRAEGRARRGCRGGALEQARCRSARSGGLCRPGLGVGQRWACWHRWLQKRMYWKLFLLLQGDYWVLKNRLEPVKTGEVSHRASGSRAARADARPCHRTVLIAPVPQPRRGAGTPGTPAGTVPPGGVLGRRAPAPRAETASRASSSLRVAAGQARPGGERGSAVLPSSTARAR